MANKMTITQKYEALISKYEDIFTEDEVAFLTERKELHAKKASSKKMTKAQEENEEIKAQILDAMKAENFYTVTDIMKMVGLESNQKTSALVRQLKEAKLVIRSESKGKAYFKKA